MTNWILNIIVLPHYTELKISTCPRCFSVHYLETKLFSLFYSTHCMNINSHILFNFEYFLVVRFSWLWYNIYTIYYRAWPNIFCRWYVPGFPLTKHGGWDGWRWGRPELVHTENSFNLTFFLNLFISDVFRRSHRLSLPGHSQRMTNYLKFLQELAVRQVYLFKTSINYTN